MKKYKKDPTAVRDYGRNWGTWLEEGIYLTSSSYATPTGITKVSQGFSPEGQTRVRLSGGTLGDTYVITNHIIASDGQEEDTSFAIQIVDK